MCRGWKESLVETSKTRRDKTKDGFQSRTKKFTRTRRSCGHHLYENRTRGRVVTVYENRARGRVVIVTGRRSNIYGTRKALEIRFCMYTKWISASPGHEAYSYALIDVDIIVQNL